MKVFISWSGDLSKNIAEIFRQWIPAVIQAVKPYYSPEDINKGTRWNSEISKELDASSIGIICLTKDNLQSPWIMFEAGALSKNIETSKVIPLLFNIEISEIQGPLIQFQAAKFSKEEMQRVIKIINSELGDQALTLDILNNVFEMWWPKLEDQIRNAEQLEDEKAKKTNKGKSRSERDILEEVLSLTRELSINRYYEKDRFISIKPIERIVVSFGNLVSKLTANRNSDFSEQLYDIHRSIESLIDDNMKYGRGIPKQLIMKYRTIKSDIEYISSINYNKSLNDSIKFDKNEN